MPTSAPLCCGEDLGYLSSLWLLAELVAKKDADALRPERTGWDVG